MDKITLRYGHYADREVFTVACDGMSREQLRHYAHTCGFFDFLDQRNRLRLCGYSNDQKSILRHTLEMAGYVVNPDEIFAMVPWDFIHHMADDYYQNEPVWLHEGRQEFDRWLDGRELS